MKAPIIFIHYSDSLYLGSCLEMAKYSNPSKQIILIGDESNKKYEKQIGIKHVMFDDYISTEDLREFDEVFQFIAGTEFEKKTYGKKWTIFNFKKWFVLNSFLKQNGYTNGFWTFDSDVMIVTDLEKIEKEFDNIDYTIGNSMLQFSGYCRDISFTENFKNHILGLFKNEDYVNEQKQIMKENPTWGFTMMRAFESYHHWNNSKIEPIFNVSKDFVGVLFCNYLLPHEDKYEPYCNSTPELFKLFLSNNSLFFKKGEGFKKIGVLNTSWMNPYAIQKLCLNLKKTQLTNDYKVFSMEVTIFFKIVSKLKRIFI